MTLEIGSAAASTFSGRVNTKFRLTGQPVPELELVEVVDGSKPPHINFSLVFRGPHQPLLRQGVYAFEHDELGRFELFIVPVARDAEGLKYQAIFNRVETSRANERA